MSDPILPLAVWQSGTNENSIPANDNSLRLETLSRLVISMSTTAQPGSPSDGDVYIIPAGATGIQWATFDEDDLTIFKSGTWYAWAPVTGVHVNVDGTLYAWDSGWSAISSGGGGGPSNFSTASIASGVVDLTDETVGVWIVSLTANVTSVLLPTAVGSEALSIIVIFVQDGTGGRTVSGWPTTIWEAGSAPTVASGAGALTSVPLVILGNGDIYGVS